MRFSSLALLSLLAVLATKAHGAFILDDFDDAAQMSSPEMFDDFTVTEDVGLLNAQRSIRLAATALGPRVPVGSIDANISTPGELTLDVTKVGSTDNGSPPIFAFQFNYDIPPTDISEEGRNDAILFDFTSIEATYPPNFLRVIVRDDSNRSSYEVEVLNLPLQSGLFTAVMPFESFTVRGGSPGQPDFSTIKQLDFDIYFINPALDAQWSGSIASIRFGRIPEPNSVILLVLSLTCFLCSRRHNVF